MHTYDSVIFSQVGLVEVKGFVAELTLPHSQSVWESRRERVTVCTVRPVYVPVLKLQRFVLI